MKSPRVVYWNNIPTPYVVGRFNELARRGNLEFEAWFNAERESDRSWEVRADQWEYPARYIPAETVGGRQLLVPISELKQVRPDLLVSLYGDPSFALGVAAGRYLASRSAIRVLPTYDSWVKRSAIKEATKKLIFRSVDSAKVPGADGGALAARYGLPDFRIQAVTQSIDVEFFGRAREVSEQERIRGRNARGLNGCVFLYVGRIWSGKGLDTLFEAYRSTRERNSSVSLLIVGDGIDQDRYMALASNIPGVHFEGFCQPSDLPSLYALADAFVFPTLGDPHGLVVEESMAAGVPVISSAAAGDIHTRLPDGEAGFIVPPSDAEALAERMLNLASDPSLRTRFAQAGTELVRNRDHYQYARDFERFVEMTLKLPRRNGFHAKSVEAIGRGIVFAQRKRSVGPLISGDSGQ